MGLVSSLFKRSSPYTEAFTRGDDLPNQWGDSGAVVMSEPAALYAVPVYACVRILSETIASLPLHMYLRLATGGKTRATQHELAQLLHDQPNPDMSAFEMREALVGHLCLWGNAYAEIQRDKRGRVEAIWPLRPDRMTVERTPEIGLIYRYRLGDGTEKIFPGRQIWHIRGLSSNGVVGYSPIHLASQSIGLYKQTETYGSKFFSNDSRPGGVLKTASKLSPESADRLKETWEAAHRGSGNAWRVAVLEEGLDWQQIGIAPDDAQFLETRKFQITEIARLFRVPPHMLADLEQATFSNIEHQSIEFVTHTIRPWLVRIEQSISRSLIADQDRGSVFAEHMIDGLLRGDIQSRYAAYAVGRQWGWLSVDEIREKENLNPLPDEKGTEYLVPMNMLPAGEQPPESVSGGDTEGQLE